MMKKTAILPFAETEEQSQKLARCIDLHRHDKGAMMPILQEAQGIYGYLPIEVQSRIADELGVPLEDLYGVATFYSQFTLVPKGRFNVSICLGTACYVKGSGDILEELIQTLGIKPEETTADGKFSLTACRCIGACGLAPVLTVGDEVFGRLQKGQTAEIIATYNDRA